MFVYLKHTMAESDKLNIDSIIARLLEGELPEKHQIFTVMKPALNLLWNTGVFVTVRENNIDTSFKVLMIIIPPWK